MSRKQTKRGAGSMVNVTIAGFFVLIVIGGVGLGVASADSMDDVERAGAFGFSRGAHVVSGVDDADERAEADGDMVFYERSALATASPRDLHGGMKMIDDMERAERERKIADNAAAIDRVVAMKAKQGIETSHEALASAAFNPDDIDEYDLPAVDWSVGKDAFVAEWAFRIDEYLAGSPLSGYGPVFAEAAWDNGVDPRWSPAISNTESSKGAVCFRVNNAWGWGNSGWDDWDIAIRAHVAGLANGYGYSITPSAAQKYCPPTWQDWYSKTIDQMAVI